MASVQHPSTRRRAPILPLGKPWLFAPIAGYWLLAAIVVVVRPSLLDLLLLGLPLAALSVVLCAGQRRRGRFH